MKYLFSRRVLSKILFASGSFLTWTIGLPGSSHAKATLARGSDVTIRFNLSIIKTRIKAFGASTTGNKDCLIDLRSRNLVRCHGAVKGGYSTDDDGEQESKDGILHGTFGFDVTYSTDLNGYYGKKNQIFFCEMSTFRQIVLYALLITYFIPKLLSLVLKGVKG